MPVLGILMVAVYAVVDPAVFYDPAWLILVGNTLFVTVVGLVVSAIALMNYRATGRVQILLLGCGVFVFGIGGAVAAALRSLPDGANLNVTIYNSGALLGAIFHFVAAFILLTGTSPGLGSRRRGWWLALGYGGSVVVVATLTGAALLGLTRPFFVQGVGPTVLRQTILGGADILFLFACLIFLGIYLRTRDVFLYWYGCALALTAISLTAFFVQTSVGSPVGWVGRFAQYLGGVYFLVSLLSAMRAAHTRGTSLGRILTGSLSLAEEKFRALAEDAPDMIRSFDRDLRHVYANTACERVYGRPARTIIGRTMEEAGLPAPQCRVWAERIQGVFATGERLEVEDDVPIGSSTAFYQSYCVPEYGPDGAVANVLVVSRDLTRRKQAEEQTRRDGAVVAGIARIFREALTCESEQQLGRACLAVAEEVTQSQFGFINEINPETGNLDNVAISDLAWDACRMPIADAGGHGQRVPRTFAVRGIYARVLRDGDGFFTNDPASHPDSVGTPDGHLALRSFLGVPLRHAGRTIGLIALANREGGYRAHDLAAVRALVPAVVQAINSHRADRALRIAKGAAEEANRQKDRFLTALAHELRNPLAPMRNSVAILKRPDAGEPARARARDALDRQVTHMARLIDDLLDVSRIVLGKITLRRQDVDLTGIVRAAVEDHRPLLEANGLRLDLSAPAAPIGVSADPARVAQVVGNLLVNAAKFTDRGGTVMVTVESIERKAVIRVCDTGIGMDAETLRYLFQPFAQADSSMDRSQGGLGLGLALVKGLVELHGGTVRATSAGLGRGSEFVIALPAVAGDVEPLAPSPAPAARPGRTRRVLVIEDNEDAADTLRMLLEGWGHTVAVAGTAVEGLEKAHASGPDVILCDIGLPGGMDGCDLARKVRATPELRGVLLVAMSGYGRAEDRARARGAGFDEYLIKPADPDALERLLAR